MLGVNVSAKVRIGATPEIVRTLKIYTKGLQFCVNQAWKRKIKNNIKLHPFVYKSLRKRRLPAQLSIACIKQACGIVKKAKTKPIINQASIRYNFSRSASLHGNFLSIRTIKGRQKFEIKIPSCYKKYFRWKLCESLLKIDRKGRCFFMFCFSKDIAERKSKKIIGIDLGLNNIAVTSDKRFFNGSKIKFKRRNFQRLRNKLQAKGTRSAKRLLKKVSGRERRFMAWINHKISKEIVETNAGAIALEDLKGIRKARRGKRMNFWLHKWSFYQLQSFIRYKAERKGIGIIDVNPYMTSQTCSHCGEIGSRSKGFFVCDHCGYSLNADLNASVNLAKHDSNADCVSGSITAPNIRTDEHEGSL